MGTQENNNIKHQTTPPTTKLWPVPNKPLENPPPPRLPKKLSPERQPVKPLPLEVVSRSHTDSDQEPSLSERSEDTKRPLIFFSGSFHSRDSLERSPVSSTTTLDSNPPLSWLFKRLLRPTSLDSSRTPTSAPSTPRESPSCSRMSNSPEESEVK